MNGLVLAMQKQFGGIRGLSKVWSDEIKREMERAKKEGSSLPLMRSMLAYMNLLTMVEQNRKPDTSLSHLTDEEFAEVQAESLQQQLLGLIRQEPKIVLWAAETMDGKCVPPGGDEELAFAG